MPETVPPPPAPGGSAAATPRPPLRRARDGRILTGLGAGLARTFDMDVSVVRILLVLLALLTNGVVLVAYLVGSLFVPRDDDGSASPQPSASAERRDPTFWVGVALLVVASIWLLTGPASPGHLFGVLFRADVLLALILIGFGVALWRSGDRAPTSGRHGETEPESRPAPTVVPVGPVRSTPTTGPRAVAHTRLESDMATPSTDTAPVQTWSPPPAPVRERSLLGRVTIGIALVVVGVLWLLRTAGVLPLDVVQLVAAGLVVVGAGLLVGAFAGRARWLILVGILLTPLVVAGALLRPVITPGWSSGALRDGGEMVVVPTSPSELDSAYRLGGGRMVVDLREMELDASDRHATELELGAGEMTVLLPDDVTATVDAQVGIGELRIDDTVIGGLGLSRTRVVEVGDGSAELDIRARVGAGQLAVRAP